MATKRDKIEPPNVHGVRTRNRKGWGHSIICIPFIKVVKTNLPLA